MTPYIYIAFFPNTAALLGQNTSEQHHVIATNTFLLFDQKSTNFTILFSFHCTNYTFYGR